MKKINAKCLSFKELSYTATGYIMPCCWVDTPIALIEPQIARLRKEHLKLENNEKIEDIINIEYSDDVGLILGVEPQIYPVHGAECKEYLADKTIEYYERN